MCAVHGRGAREAHQRCRPRRGRQPIGRPGDRAGARDSQQREAADPRYGTRPADIKRYLKPLLELRSDLVVVGRLLIRPVRHLLRGALFERTSDKYRFGVRPYIQPVFRSPKGCGYGDLIFGRWEVWQPHFVPLLMDCLATEAFDRWAPVITLDGLATR